MRDRLKVTQINRWEQIIACGKIAVILMGTDIKRRRLGKENLFQSLNLRSNVTQINRWEQIKWEQIITCGMINLRISDAD